VRTQVARFDLPALRRFAGGVRQARLLSAVGDASTNRATHFTDRPGDQPAAPVNDTIRQSASLI
jgi:hypothetical protein